jgi:hypothetical protein
MQRLQMKVTPWQLVHMLPRFHVVALWGSKGFTWGRVLDPPALAPSHCEEQFTVVEDSNRMAKMN